MKSAAFLLFFCLFASWPVQALQFQVVGKNGELLFQQQLLGGLPKTVNDISIMAFEAYGIPFNGSSHGIFSIYGLSTKLEVLNPGDMKLYGWCYSIDGYAPNTLPKDIYVHKQSITLMWSYSYTHFVNSVAVAECIPHGH